MKIQEIATRLADYCRKGDFETAQRELYADDVVSIEPMATPDFEKETKGLPAVLKKIQKFMGMVETLHSSTVSNPLLTDNVIAFTMTMDITMRGKRTNMSELCVYQVKEGKVTSEQFFM